jgi:hypothetical protein
MGDTRRIQRHGGLGPAFPVPNALSVACVTNIIIGSRVFTTGSISVTGASAYADMHFVFLDLRKKMQALQKLKHEREQVQVHGRFPF